MFHISRFLNVSDCVVMFEFHVIVFMVQHRAVTESINQLITACAVSAAPGQKECDAALRQIQVSSAFEQDIGSGLRTI